MYLRRTHMQLYETTVSYAVCRTGCQSGSRRVVQSLINHIMKSFFLGLVLSHEHGVNPMFEIQILVHERMSNSRAFFCPF